MKARSTLLLVLTGVLWTTPVLGDLDFHFGQGESLMPGVRVMHRERSLRTPPPPHPAGGDPILFPGSSSGGSVPVGAHEGPAEEPIEDPKLPTSVPDGTLELPLNSDEIDISILKRMNSVSNISEFANLFNLELPKSKTPPSFDGFSIGGRTGIPLGDAAETFPMANCKQELVTVPLDLPQEAGSLFFPTCIRLEQCGGCCIGSHLTCRPTVTKAIKVKVLKVNLSGSNSRRSQGGGRRSGGRRRRRQNEQSYIEVPAVRHTACACGCKVREEDCHSDLHTYFEGECSCICKNKDEEAKCLQQNTTKYWDNDSCSCYCLKPLECSTGESFSHATCRCEHLSARAGLVSFEAGPSRRRRKPVRVPIT